MRRDFERTQRRFMLDSVPDFSTDGGSLSFRQSFDVFESPETYFRAPDDIVELGRRLLDFDLVDTLAKHVHDNVTVRIGCSLIPLFALENGGRGRSLFTFRCVYGGVPRFSTCGCFPASTRSSGS